MRTLLVLGVAGCMLTAATNAVLAQRADLNPDSNPTLAVVNQLFVTWQKTTEETVKKQIVTTLENMGAPVAQPLAIQMEREFRSAAAKGGEEQKPSLDKVIVAAKILGKQGNAVARDDYVTETLLAFTHPSKKVAGQSFPIKVPEDVRVEAITALGKIFAQKAVFLVLQSPNETTREKNKEALTAVENLRNETQDLKRRITPWVEMMKDVKDKNVKDTDGETARDLLLATRNLCRKFKVYQKLLFIMSELEPPIGKEKDLNTRIGEALSEIEANLRDVWAPPSPGKGPAKEAPDATNDNIAIARKHSSAMAEQKAYELSDEMDDLVQRVDAWLQINDRTRKVILTFQILVRFDEPGERPNNGTIINICAAEALGRVYGSRD